MDFNYLKVKLQFEEIIKKLKEFVKSEENFQNIFNTQPFNSLYEANEEIREVSVWQNLLSEEQLTAIDLKDSRNIFMVLNKEGSFLQPKELLSVAHLLYLSKIYKDFIDNLSEDFSLLKIKYQNKLHRFNFIENLITSKFDETGEFNDNASPELKSIRSKIRDTRNHILDKLNNFLFSGFASTIIQEPIITIRNNRYVIPLKPNFSQKVKGIIQDYSSSGQTVFVEPEFVLQFNNKLAYLRQEEYYEKIKILTELTEILRENYYEIIEVYKTLLILDFKIAKAKFAKKYNLNSIELNSDSFFIKDAKNPLLLLNNKKVIPIDIKFENKNILIISGANTGGKTVALKTAGLISLMAQCGFPVPADSESSIKYFSKIFIDIGDSQDISGDLSTYSAHIKNINSFLHKCDSDSLVLIDELGTSTDPKEGAAIGRAIIEFLLKKGSFAIITTHIEELKFLNYIYNLVENVSVDFDENTITPKYKLIYGISGRSYAIKIAELLNFNKEVIQMAKSYYNESVSDFLKEVINIENIKRELFKKERELYLKQQELLIAKEKYIKLKEKLIKDKEKIKDLIKEKYNTKYNRLLFKIDDILDNLKKELKTKEYAKLKKETSNTVNIIKNELSIKKEEKKANEDNYKISNFYIGLRVKHIKTNAKGRVISIDSDTETIEILFDNNLKLHLKPFELRPINDKNTNFENFHISQSVAIKSFKINVIGKTVDEALFEIEKFIDHAILNNISKIEIIHGKGSGRLKKAISEYLKNSNFVVNFYSPLDQHGGEGITVVEL